MQLVLLLMTAAAAAVYGSTAVRKLGDMPENLYAKEQKAFKHWSAHLSGYTGFSTASSSPKENTASWVCTVAPKTGMACCGLPFIGRMSYACGFLRPCASVHHGLDVSPL
ncbi:uncharacterized protein LOC115631807 [Scaptodrosophila lebanonensis]|uniref:Uncharacterized protein LOC115624959 n=2 Tax=Drosophila lebanonensis TaxID=7225 RepID=A0A6J2TI25_DROLE|nr:uncharacterized protein LOC115624959 [Scaptodrosophila lebanonensis]XP_030379947.1 uncharacterized protein LOC115628106 [Scaptodrosophila lebanonensis]XP_030379957.1 uncharacterized protein LOC115628111 [Scaptodrosophila lebanonensis]XP_030384504.1 uncharacterized protein LOC115631807 [Scaptodrosophila lebanonensis]